MMANKNGSNTSFHLYRGPEAFMPQKGGHLLCQTWETWQTMVVVYPLVV